MTNEPFPPASALPEVLGEAFPRSSAETRTAVALAADVRIFSAGETILRQGDETSLALVIDGHVAMRRTTVEGRELLVRIVERGKLAVILPFSARPAGADAVALTTGPIARWQGADLLSLATLDPGLGIDLLDQTLAAFEEVVARFDGLLYQDARRRVARALNVHTGLFFGERPVLTRASLPMLVGCSREMTSRVLRALESGGLVARVGRDRLRLLDPAGLAAAAESDGDRSRVTRGTNSSS